MAKQSAAITTAKKQIDRDCEKIDHNLVVVTNLMLNTNMLRERNRLAAEYVKNLGGEVPAIDPKYLPEK